MATATAPRMAGAAPERPSFLLHTLLPLFGFLFLVAAHIAGLTVVALLFLVPRGAEWFGLPHDVQPVLRRVAEPMQVRGADVPGAVWWLILIPVLVVGVFYVVWMYSRDGRAVGGAWALFLGMLRWTTYLFLAGVFLLPGCQHWEESHSQSRVVLGFDVTQSLTDVRDGIPPEGTPVEKLPTRQDQVVQFLTSPKAAFLKRLQDRNPVFAYRFGRSPDEDYTVHTEGGAWSRRTWEERARARAVARADDKLPPVDVKPWTLEEWQSWLKPTLKAAPPDDMNEEDREKFFKRQEQLQRLFGGTNVGDSVLTVLNREANNMVQGLVVFSDGRSNEGSAAAYRELADRAQKAKVPIFVVAVGEDRPQVHVDITDLRVPDQVRPDDKFKVIVDVSGEGLAEQPCDVSLDVIDPNGLKAGPPLKPKVPLKFKPGEPPHAEAEFELEAAMFPGAKVDEKTKKPEFEEGVWKFVARVPRDRRESFVKPEHVTDPAEMRVIKRPLRVLLFASAPTRDYQYLRTLLVRETEKHRVELSIYLEPAPGQSTRRPGIVQDVPPERLLSEFPNHLRDEASDTPDNRLYNLAAYDLIVAFDPDWTRLSPEQLSMVERWVGTHGGGLIVVGGPVNTLQLARPGPNHEKLKPILDIYPVVLQDSRIQEADRSTADPWRLNFPGASPELEFLKIDEDNDAQLAGWEEFFTGDPKGGKTVVRGFYNYYPVERAKEGATVVATFSDPRARLADGKEQPYLVTMPYGAGKVVWLGQGETWRLRGANHGETYQERFWTKLCRYGGSGNATKLNKRVTLLMGRTFTANRYVPVEAQVFGLDLLPLPEKARPTLELRVPTGSGDKEIKTTYELTPRPSQGEWNGWFTTRFLVKTPGEYKVLLKVPDTGDTVEGKFLVKEANPELDNTRPDFDQLYWLASEATEVLNRVDEDTQKQLKATLAAARPRLQQSDQPNSREAAVPNKDESRLYFNLQTAELIPSCMVTAERNQRSRGAVVDLWDKGPLASLPIVNLILLVVNALLVVLTLLVAGLVVLSLARGKGAEGLTYLLFLGVMLFTLVPLQLVLRWLDKPVLFSAVLMTVITLLAVEWLGRKLLRLA